MSENNASSVISTTPQDFTLSQSRRFLPRQESFPGFLGTEHQLPQDNPFAKYLGVRAWHEYTPNPPLWLVDGILHFNTININDGLGGGGKSLLALQLAISVASGAPWLDFQVKQYGHVIYLNAEDPDAESHRRYLRMLKKLNLTNEQLQRLQDNLTHVPMSELDDVDSALVDANGLVTNTYKSLQEITRAVKPLLIIIDPLVYFSDGNENDTVSAKRLYSALKALKSTVLLLHHMSKSAMNNETSQRAKSRGSSVFTENARTRMSLENGVLTIDKNNYGRRYEGDDAIRIRLEEGAWRRMTPTEIGVSRNAMPSKKDKRVSF